MFDSKKPRSLVLNFSSSIKVISSYLKFPLVFLKKEKAEKPVLTLSSTSLLNLIFALYEKVLFLLTMFVKTPVTLLFLRPLF